ncbi:MAG: sensor domain-containing protein [Thermoanaerobaculia bacterium]|nr:sensor domain-containing protein [Thermoanaerobaculia bacterium]
MNPEIPDERAAAPDTPDVLEAVEVAAAPAPPAFEEAPQETSRGRQLLAAVFGVFADRRAYGSLAYMLIAMATGTIYFTFATTGLALSLGLAILIIGVPFFVAFVATARGLAWLEGKLVGALTGERMAAAEPLPSGWRRILAWLRDRRTWTSLFYQLLQLPLGIAYFTAATIAVVFAAALVAVPIGLAFAGEIRLDGLVLELPLWVVWPLFWLAAGVVLLLTLHVARGVGLLHGRMARVLLVRA